MKRGNGISGNSIGNVGECETGEFYSGGTGETVGCPLDVSLVACAFDFSAAYTVRETRERMKTKRIGNFHDDGVTVNS